MLFKKEEFLIFHPYLLVFFLWRPLVFSIPSLMRLSLIFFVSSTTNLVHLRHHGFFGAGDDQPQTKQPYGQAGS